METIERTRTNLLNVVNEVNVPRNTRLATCKAKYGHVEDANAIILTSYNTRVAVLDLDNKVFYVLDYYSATTYQHIYKFIDLFKNDIKTVVWLYERSDRVITSTMQNGYLHHNKISKKEFKQIQVKDFEDYIGVYY